MSSDSSGRSRADAYMHVHQRPRPPARDEIARGHLSETASTRGLWIFAAVLIVAIALCLVLAAGVTWMYTDQLLIDDRRTLEAEIPGDLPAAGTAHWVNPSRDLTALRQNQLRRLEGYAWVDRDQGIARIPIEQAMRILAKQREAPPNAPANEPARPRPLTVPQGEGGGAR